MEIIAFIIAFVWINNLNNTCIQLQKEVKILNNTCIQSQKEVKILQQKIGRPRN